MQLGIFAKTFETTGAGATLRAAAKAGYATVQFNLACLGLPSMPDAIAPADAASVGAASQVSGVGIAAVSGTFNMIHPDPAVRRTGLRRLEVLAAACPAMSTRLITLCTGTRDPDDQWRGHPDNGSADAWRDLVEEMVAAVEIADRHDVILGVEPELANVVSSADSARRLIDEIGSPRVRIVLDPANLLETGSARERRAVVDRAVESLSPEIVMAHAKDRRADGSFTTAGCGVIDFRHFIASLQASGFEGPLVAHGLPSAEAPGVSGFLAGLLADVDAA